MRFCCLGSGSEGNGLVVESGSTRILVDCGFAVAETVLRLNRLGIEPESLAGIVVTHEHADHMGGVPRLAARFAIPVWLTYGTLSAANGRMSGLPFLNPYDGHDPFAIGDIEVFPIPVPHDAREPVQYAFGDGARRLGLLTDIGTLTPYVAESLSGCDALVLECNHDPALLAAGSYPPLLKARIAGHQGHLSNEASADLLRAIDCTKLQHLIAAHLSRENNRPELAREALAGALGCSDDWIGIAGQSLGFDWREIARCRRRKQGPQAQEHEMEKRQELYRGKAKTVYATDDPDLLWLTFRNDTSAFDGEKKAQLERKGEVNNKINAFIMGKLDDAEIHTHFVRLLSDTESLVKKLTMIPVECVVRNVVAGSMSKRLGIPEGRVLPTPIFEFFYKSDALHDPMVNDAHIEVLGWATAAQIARMKALTFRVNDVLKPLFADAGITLVDYKLEFGMFRDEMLLGDEFTPDGCRLWDSATQEKMDKDRFRRDLGNVIEKYAEVARRIGVAL